MLITMVIFIHKVYNTNKLFKQNEQRSQFKHYETGG